MKRVNGILPDNEGLTEKLFIEKRAELCAYLADVDDLIAKKLKDGVEPTSEELQNSIRKATISRKFIPVLMGSAPANIGTSLENSASVSPLLDAVTDYLPNPIEM